MVTVLLRICRLKIRRKAGTRLLCHEPEGAAWTLRYLHCHEGALFDLLVVGVVVAREILDSQLRHILTLLMFHDLLWVQKSIILAATESD